MRNYDVHLNPIDNVVSYTRANCSNSPTFYEDYPDIYPKKIREPKVEVK